MKIDSKSRSRLKITLSATEIFDYFGSFKDIRYDNENARAALGSILKKGLEASNFALSSGKLNIKVYPTDSGGCDIYFIAAGKRRLKKISKIIIFEFENCEDMLSALEQLKINIGDNIMVSVYRNGGLYRILINDRYITRKGLKTLLEYAKRIINEKFAAAKTKEHWRKICDNTPIGKII